MDRMLKIINGLPGFFLAVLLVLFVAFLAGYNAIRIQRDQALMYYKIDVQMLEKINPSNHKAVTIVE